ncbi:MAG: 3-dehydroquinate synthase [Candidatus Omnitrophota bacterium]
MKKVSVNLAERSYDILVEAGAIKRLPGLVKSMSFTGPIVIITDKVVASKADRIISPTVKRLPNELYHIVVPSTERSKSIKVFQDTTQKISRKTKTHRPMIIALGGGVVGDLAGFVAATYRRGVPLVQIPTTLLAQVDSSIGGKVGVDLPEAKNLVGAFCQPKVVLMDTDFLRTLPRRQIQNGMAEIIKYAIIKSRSLFTFLEDNMKKVLSLEKKPLERIIHECVAIKARIVEKDELDNKDIRIVLNFGHTLGHAIEAASGYSKLYNHGESIAVGMILAGEIAVRLDMLKKKELDRIKSLIKKAGLPVSLRGVSVKDIISSHAYDKKFITGSNRFVLPKRIGSVEVVEDIPELLVKTVLKEYVE